MSEAERKAQIEAIQLRLFEVKREYLLISRKLKRQLRIVQSRGMKMCRQCRIEMNIEQFYRDRYKSDGRDSYCIECRVKRRAA